VLVGVADSLTVAVGSGVLLGDCVLVGYGVDVCTIVFALGKVPDASFITPPPTRLHPLTMKVRINPRANLVIKLIVILFLPVNSFMLDNYL
jgi:hypothetical protein